MTGPVAVSVSLEVPSKGCVANDRRQGRSTEPGLDLKPLPLREERYLHVRL